MVSKSRNTVYHPVILGDEDAYLLGSVTMEGLSLAPDELKRNSFQWKPCSCKRLVGVEKMLATLEELMGKGACKEYRSREGHRRGGYIMFLLENFYSHFTRCSH
ncbi:MAG: hypothetical protein FGF52_01475 [Candidatus Brockarchaeota archaeon]|nr:hypothetical protein [Candidatus Brockarchaeota archaeon]